MAANELVIPIPPQITRALAEIQRLRDVISVLATTSHSWVGTHPTEAFGLADALGLPEGSTLGEIDAALGAAWNGS